MSFFNHILWQIFPVLIIHNSDFEHEFCPKIVWISATPSYLNGMEWPSPCSLCWVSGRWAHQQWECSLVCKRLCCKLAHVGCYIKHWVGEKYANGGWFLHWRELENMWNESTNVNIQSSHTWNGVYTKEYIEPNRVSQVWNGYYTLWMYWAIGVGWDVLSKIEKAPYITWLKRLPITRVSSKTLLLDLRFVWWTLLSSLIWSF